ncbi:MAG: glycosyltransferase family 39 protein [Thermomicrobiales bacterium]
MDQVNRPTPNVGDAEPDGSATLFRPAPFPTESEPAAPELIEAPVRATPSPVPASTVTAPLPAASPTLVVAEPSPPIAPQSANDRSAGATLRHAFGATGRNWAVLIPLVLFALAAFVVPTMTDVALAGDWLYTRAVEDLYWNIDLVAYPAMAASAMGQILWGGLFALVFGMDPGTMRLSTVVATGIGAVALFAILRMLGVSRNRSVLGTTLFLFNPFGFALAFSFLPDAHFTAWMLVAVALYAKGLDEGCPRPWLIVLGSLAAGWAFLIREQGALIPLAVVLFLIATRKVWFDMDGLKRVMQVIAAPLAMGLGYLVWVRWINGVPDAQHAALEAIRSATREDAWHVTRYQTFFAVMYLGLILIPLVVAVVPGWRGHTEASSSFRTPLGYWLFIGATGAVVSGLFFLTAQGRQMPYLPDIVSGTGLGLADVPGGRPTLIQWPEVYQVATIAAAVGAIVAGLMICRQIVPEVSPQRAVAGLVAMVALWQLVGAILSSVRFLGQGDSLDRFLLPLIPLAIALLLWSLRDVRFLDPVAWLAIAAVAGVSVAGTRDLILTQDALWSLARTASAAGVPNDRLNAGAAWDGFWLPTAQLDDPAREPGDAYVVTMDPDAFAGYIVVEQRTVDRWLAEGDATMYLLRRADAPWPPASAPTDRPDAETLAPAPTGTPTS